ncbi:glutamine amidotransferase-related protein [Marinomonas pollencensis]|uniref:GMP synthase-like glutamine amidotransferase n=1 Tax=Marinomonas pollencensis TaxID=491954 RepID=A0A3E0DKC2_9GAMM|nr:glutamine amidotransferase [Marinomonas pollencensis]REG83170.1 GMP synthase-like glutamine amidotransferase [Marinomonas pollencensis]
MKIGILAAGITPDVLQVNYPSYADMFVQQLTYIEPTLAFEIYDVRLDEFPQSAASCDGWLITGSKCNSYDDDPWILRLCDFIREIDSNKQTLVGICFGHQIIARALGGTVIKSPAGWGVGVHHYQVTSDIPTLPGATDIAFCAFHQDQVIEKPKKLNVFLRSDFCEFAGFIYQDRILTFQGHPEFSKEYESDLVELYAGVTLTPEIADKARITIKEENIQNKQLMSWIAHFLKNKPQSSDM